MKVLAIDHIGIAVKDIDRAVLLYEKVFGAKTEEIFTSHTGSMKASHVPIGNNGRLELVQAISPESRTARLVAEKGYGLTHIAIEVADLDRTIEELKAANIKFMDEKPALSTLGRRYIFTEPQSLGGVSLEFVGK